MNGWSAAAVALLLVGVAPAVWGAAGGPVRRRVLAQNVATPAGCLVLLLLAQGYERPAYADLALVLAVLGPAGTLVFARLLEDELAADPPRGRVARALTPLVATAAALVVLPLCLATDPGRATVKTLVIGALLVAGNVLSTRALTGEGRPSEASGPNAEGRPSGERRGSGG
ncbi:MrpF/PhaF family protein [Streptomyces sp. MST-110588]|uniref:monovalent cation/H+ antiporter complex subunit F n=1 Tax=Streptomyces sp. MST-110588 TaxID=2833628 RepID=UPI001F5E049F|nr:MrpF/PhaF family protein [Streptomyces sp. MST-110588]UNO38832.1 MrpF/PhaF family protein [Streptomyces sp. MST-110588]